jgi:hypothetical protein
MATMMPSDMGEFGTDGEKAFYKFLEGVAKPDAYHLRWSLGQSSVIVSLSHRVIKG